MGRMVVDGVLGWGVICLLQVVGTLKGAMVC